MDSEAVEIGLMKTSTTAAAATAAAVAAASIRPDRSSPLNMPISAASRSGAVPVLIESGSYSN